MQLKLQQERDMFIFNGRNATRDWIASSDRSIGGSCASSSVAFTITAGVSCTLFRPHQYHACALCIGLSECKWGFYGTTDEEIHPEDKRGILTSVNQEDDVPSGEQSYKEHTECAYSELICVYLYVNSGV